MFQYDDNVNKLQLLYTYRFAMQTVTVLYFYFVAPSPQNQYLMSDNNSWKVKSHTIINID